MRVKKTTAPDAPKRALLRYFGGKWRLAPWVIGHFPEHRIYVEPFGGAASVLLRKPRSKIEVYNDLDDDVVNLMRVVQRRETCEDLVRLLKRTPYARREFELSFEATEEPVERARRTVIRSFLSLQCAAVVDRRKRSFHDALHGERNDRGAPGTWWRYYRRLAGIRARFTGVIIEHRCALDVIRAQDSASTLFFVDPPYLPSTRASGAYHCELTSEQHEELLAALLNVRGRVVLCGYPSAMYDDALKDWQRVERQHFASSGGGGSLHRTEVLWISAPRTQSKRAA